MSTTERDTAESQLERILYILPAACREGGTSFTELAEALDVSVDTVRNDIEQITAREYYHPAGSIDAFAVFLEDDRVEVAANDQYKRPVRLNPREALAVELGLRVLALEAEPEQQVAIRALGRRIQKDLTAPDASADASDGAVEYDVQEEAEVLLAVGDDSIRGLMSDAIAQERACTLSYIKHGERSPEERRIAPQKLLYHEGKWYVLAYDYARKDTRFFRLDRVLDASLEDGRESLQPLNWTMGDVGFPYLADDDRKVAVRYSPRIASWISERTGEAPQDDGSVVVVHRVADPHWLVRHVMQYGGEAVVEDERYCAMVRETAERLATV